MNSATSLLVITLLAVSTLSNARPHNLDLAPAIFLSTLETRSYERQIGRRESKLLGRTYGPFSAAGVVIISLLSGLAFCIFIGWVGTGGGRSFFRKIRAKLHDSIKGRPEIPPVGDEDGKEDGEGAEMNVLDPGGRDSEPLPTVPPPRPQRLQTTIINPQYPTRASSKARSGKRASTRTGNSGPPPIPELQSERHANAWWKSPHTAHPHPATDSGTDLPPLPKRPTATGAAAASARLAAEDAEGQIEGEKEGSENSDSDTATSSTSTSLSHHDTPLHTSTTELDYRQIFSRHGMLPQIVDETAEDDEEREENVEAEAEAEAEVEANEETARIVEDIVGAGLGLGYHSPGLQHARSPGASPGRWAEEEHGPRRESHYYEGGGEGMKRENPHLARMREIAAMDEAERVAWRETWWPERAVWSRDLERRRWYHFEKRGRRVVRVRCETWT